MFRFILISLLSCSLLACATAPKKSAAPAPASQPTQHKLGLADQSYLENGKRLFEEGFYKKAMQQLLPVAVNGNAEAQYAVGYMYYYGFGVAQDTNVGYFWIQRSAAQHYTPAVLARDDIQIKHERHVKRKPYPSQLR